MCVYALSHPITFSLRRAIYVIVIFHWWPAYRIDANVACTCYVCMQHAEKGQLR